MDLCVSQNNPSLWDVFDCVFGSATFPCQTADTASKVIAFERLDVLDIKRVEVEVVQAKQGERIIDLESQNESPNKICRFLQVGNVLGVLASLDLNISGFQVESEKWKIDNNEC